RGLCFRAACICRGGSFFLTPTHRLGNLGGIQSGRDAAARIPASDPKGDGLLLHVLVESAVDGDTGVLLLSARASGAPADGLVCFVRNLSCAQSLSRSDR